MRNNRFTLINEYKSKCHEIDIVHSSRVGLGSATCNSQHVISLHSRRGLLVPSHFTSIVGPAVRTLLADKMVATLPCFLAILAIDIDNCVLECGWHRLHSNGLVQKRKVVTHVLHTSHAEWARIVLATAIFREARKMHYVTTSKTLQWFRRIE